MQSAQETPLHTQSFLAIEFAVSVKTVAKGLDEELLDLISVHLTICNEDYMAPKLSDDGTNNCAHRWLGGDADAPR